MAYSLPQGKINPGVIMLAFIIIAAIAAGSVTATILLLFRDTHQEQEQDLRRLNREYAELCERYLS